MNRFLPLAWTSSCQAAILLGEITYEMHPHALLVIGAHRITNCTYRVIRPIMLMYIQSDASIISVPDGMIKGIPSYMSLT